MEPEFDKVIDALLRSSPGGGGLAAGVLPDHPDAEAIAAFAENALPAAARPRYAAHFADCDRCRTVLAETIALNAEAAPEAAPVSAAQVSAASSAVPWYRTLFAVPNLALVTGALVLLFSGFIGYMVLRDGGAGSEITQIAEDAPQAGMPMAAEEADLASETSNTAAAANIAVPNTNAARAATNTAAAAEQLRAVTNSNAAAESRPPATPFSLDGASNTRPEPRPAPAAAPPPPVETVLDAEAARKVEERPQIAADAQTQIQNQSLPNARSGPVQMAPGIRAAESAKRKSVSNESYRDVAGKSFERKEGVWYDRAYSGQRTTNVRRGTDRYAALDPGLRSIGDTLQGVVVVLWKGTAYRIE